MKKALTLLIAILIIIAGYYYRDTTTKDIEQSADEQDNNITDTQGEENNLVGDTQQEGNENNDIIFDGTDQNDVSIYKFTQSGKRIRFTARGSYKRKGNIVYREDENGIRSWPELGVYVSPEDTLETFVNKLKKQYKLCDFRQEEYRVQNDDFTYSTIKTNEIIIFSKQGMQESKKCNTSLGFVNHNAPRLQEYSSGVFIISNGLKSAGGIQSIYID